MRGQRVDIEVRGVAQRGRIGEAAIERRLTRDRQRPADREIAGDGGNPAFQDELAGRVVINRVKIDPWRSNAMGLSISPWKTRPRKEKGLSGCRAPG